MLRETHQYEKNPYDLERCCACCLLQKFERNVYSKMALSCFTLRCYFILDDLMIRMGLQTRLNFALGIKDSVDFKQLQFHLHYLLPLNYDRKVESFEIALRIDVTMESVVEKLQSFANSKQRCFHLVVGYRLY
jgi:hypothetical protein